MAKKYSSVLDLVKDTSTDKAFNQSFETLIKSKQIAKALFSLRSKAKMSQEDVAKKMNCTQGKISKIERSNDLDFSIDDLVRYCSAVNMKLEIGFSDSRMELVDRVKYHYFMLKNLLEGMREMANGDETLEKGVETFTKEAFVNISFGLLECVQNASKKNKIQSPLHVSNPVSLNNINQELNSEEREALV